MMLCYVFFIKKVVLAHQGSLFAEKCLHRAKDFSAPCAALLAKSWDCKRSWEEIKPGHLTPTQQKDFLI